MERTTNHPDDSLLERELELAQLRECIDALRSAQAGGVCVLLSGEAGGGKTSLLAHAARSAGSDVEWLWGACEPMLSPQPLGALIGSRLRLESAAQAPQ